MTAKCIYMHLTTKQKTSVTDLIIIVISITEIVYPEVSFKLIEFY